MNRHTTTHDARFLELLERRHTGAFTAADERELHALLQGDPFLREAWEGYLALPEVDHAVYLARIRQRLRDAPQRRRTPFVLWMSAAAAALALLATAVYFWPKAGNTGLDALARTEEILPPDRPQDLADARDLADAPAATESTSPLSGPTAAAPRASRAEQESGSAVQDVADMAIAEESAGTAPVPVQEALEDAVPPERVRSVPQSQPLPAAPSTVESADKMVATEVAKPAAPAGNARKKRDSALAKEMARPAATAPAAAEPVGGWENFRAFARSNTRLPEAARDNNIEGTVRLLFTVGPDRKPANLRVLQSLGYGCDEEAERLVRLFEWLPVGASAEVALTFGR